MTCIGGAKMLTLTDTKTGVIGVGLGVTGHLNFVTTKGAEFLGIKQLQQCNDGQYINLEDYLFLNNEKIQFKQMMSTLQESGNNSTLLKLCSNVFVWAEIIDASALLIHTIKKMEADAASNRIKNNTKEISTNTLANLIHDKKLTSGARAELEAVCSCSNSGDSSSSRNVIMDINELEGLTGLKRVDTGLGLSDNDSDENDSTLIFSEKNRKRHDSISDIADAYDEKEKVEFEGMSMYHDTNDEEKYNSSNRGNRALSDAQSSTYTNDTTTSSETTKAESVSSIDKSGIDIFRTTPMKRFEYVVTKDENSYRSDTADTEYWSGSSDSSNRYSGTDRWESAQHTDTEEELNFEDVFEEYTKDPVSSVNDSLKRIRISPVNGDNALPLHERSLSRSPKLPARECPKNFQRTLLNRQTEPLLTVKDDKVQEDDGGWFVGSI